MKECGTDKEVLGRRILLAEDTDSNYLLVKVILKEYTLVRVNNGLEAVELLRKIPFDLVLMDIRMPIMDGLEATIRIREYNKQIPIIAFTANAYDSDKIRAMNAGCNDFLSKPVKREELINLVISKLGEASIQNSTFLE